MLIKETYPKFLNYLKQKGCAEKTIKNYKLMLEGALSHSVEETELKDLKLTDVVKVLEAGRNHGRFGSQRSISSFRCLLRFLQESGEQLPFDWRLIKVPYIPPKPVEYLTDEELDLVRETVDLSTIKGLRFRVLIEVMYSTGLRIGEALELNREQIDWQNKEASVVNNKTKETEKVYFTDRSLNWIRQYLEVRNDNFSALFFSGQSHCRLTMTAAKHEIAKLRKKLETKGFRKHLHYHLFRKSFVTKLIHKGADIRSVQYLARHRSPRTTLNCYAGLDKERAKEVHQRIFDS